MPVEMAASWIFPVCLCSRWSSHHDMAALWMIINSSVSAGCLGSSEVDSISATVTLLLWLWEGKHHIGWICWVNLRMPAILVASSKAFHRNATTASYRHHASHLEHYHSRRSYRFWSQHLRGAFSFGEDVINRVSVRVWKVSADILRCCNLTFPHLLSFVILSSLKSSFLSPIL